MTTPAGPRASPEGPAPCEAARAISIETLPTTPALVCARCGATIRAGASPALEVWCPRRARAEGGGGPAVDTLTLGPTDAPVGEAPRTLGRWRLLDLLGQGGAGVVYRAWDTLLDRAVALKVLPGGVLAGPNAVARFHREARAAGQLDVPGVVRVLDVGGTPDGALWIAMELVEGPSLADVRADGPLSPERAARFVRGVAETLAVVHRAGLAHRDVKPSNIVLDPRGRPILVDFGLAVPLDGESDLTRGPVGTPAFMAPEQRRGEPGLDWRLVDVYALGRVLDTLVAARPPDLAAVVAVATAEAPADRYPSAEALAADLGAWLDGRPVSARRAGAWRRVRLFARRHRRRLLAGALAAAVIVAAGGAAWGARRVRAQAARAERERVLQEQLDHLLPQVARTDAAGGDGEALLLAFVDDPANARTAARARAWAGRAEALDAAGEGAGAREAWARSLVAARRPVDRSAALLGLVRSLGQERDWPRMHRALALLAAEAPTVVPPESDPLIQALAVGTGDLARAARGSPEDAAFLRSFATMEQILDDGRFSFARQGVAPGGGDLVVLDVVDPLGLVVVDREGARRLPDAPGPCADAVVFWDDGPGRRLRGVLPDRIADCGPGLGGHVARVGDDLVWFVRNTRSLLSRPVGDPGATPAPFDAGLDALDSYITNVVPLDVDDDGRAELLTAGGSPLDYSLRVWDVDGAPRQRAALRLGMVLNVVRYGPGLLATGTSAERPSRWLFSEDAPFGAPPGLHLLRADHDGLHLLQSIPNPAPPAVDGPLTWTSPMGAADFDGDGRLDIVTLDLYDQAGRPRMGLHRQLADGRFRSWWLDDWRPVAVAELDGDPAPEVLATRGWGDATHPTALYVLGAGTTPLPTVTLADPAPATPGSPVEADLARLGLDADAARAWLRRAAIEPADAVRRALYTAAAEAHAADGNSDGAGDAWAEAARLGGPDAGVAWAQALDAWVAAGAFDRAREAAAALPASDRSALVAAVTDAPRDALRDPAWQLRPGLARWNLRDGTIDAEGVAGAGALARLPVERLGDAVRARIGLRVARQEWGSGVTVQLGPPEVEAAIFRTLTMGGGGFLLHETVFRRPAPAGCRHRALQSEAALGVRIVLDVVLSTRGGWLAARDDDGPLLQCTIAPLDRGGADWVLDVTALQTGPAGPLARVQIDEVSLWGLRPRVEPVAPELATPAPLAVPRLQPDDPVFWSSPDALARFRAVWEGSITDHGQDAEVREALLRAPDPRPLARRSADARWLLVARGRAAWLAGDADRAERELTAALEAPADASEWSERVTARAILAEIALASGDRAAAQRAREAALAEAPTREAGETSLLRHPELAALTRE